jgi:hypothetical protein
MSDVKGLPPEPGTAPIPEGHVRLYHQTHPKHVESIRKNGILLSHARGIEGPKAIYADEQGFYGKPSEHTTVEFHVPKEQFSKPFVRSDAVKPESIVGIHEPWHHITRYLHKDGLHETLRGDYDDMLDDPHHNKAISHLKTHYGEGMEKALHIQNLRNTKSEKVFRLSRQDDPSVAVNVEMYRSEHHEPGHWRIENIKPHSEPDPNAKGWDRILKTPAKVPYESMKGKFGPAHLREFARHLKAEHGVTTLSGIRVTGARAKANTNRLRTEVELGKALRLTAHQPFPVQSGANKQVGADWHHEGTSENPMNPNKRVISKKPTWIEGPAKVGTYELREDATRMNHFHVNEVQAVTRGGGQAAMQHLTQMADRHGVSLQLIAEPLKPQGEGVKMTRTKLRSWYQKHGFRPRQGDLMVRTPTKLEKSMPTPFTDLKHRLEKGLIEDVASGVKAGAKTLGVQMKHKASMVQRGAKDIAQGRVGAGVRTIKHAVEMAGKNVKDAVSLGVEHFQRQQTLSNLQESDVEKSMHPNSFVELSERLQKSWFMDRRVRFGSANNPVNEGRTTTTMMADGKAKKVTTGPVKSSRVPDAKKDKLKKEVETIAPSDFTTNRAGDPMLSPSAEFVSDQLARKKIKTKDTDTTKRTFRRDGSVDAIQLFAKALRAHLEKSQRRYRADEEHPRHIGRDAWAEHINTSPPNQKDPRTAHTFAVTHEDKAHEMNVYLENDPSVDKPGEWSMQVHAERSRGNDRRPLDPNKAKGTWGPTHMRNVVRHIKEKYGVEKLKIAKRTPEGGVGSTKDLSKEGLPR